MWLGKGKVIHCWCIGPVPGEKLCPCQMRTKEHMDMGERWKKIRKKEKKSEC